MSETKYKSLYKELTVELEKLIGLRRQGPWIEDLLTEFKAKESKAKKTTLRKAKDNKETQKQD